MDLNKWEMKMTPNELFQKHKSDPSDGGSGFHTWQEEIFKRIERAIKDDEEALALFEHTLHFAEMKSRCAGF